MKKKKGWVLIVDDDIETRSLLGSWLRQEGYQIQTAASGTEALSRVESRGFDLVITDFSMPGMDGVQLTAALRICDPSLPVILASGHVPAEARLVFERAGGQAILVKPYPLSSLEVLLQRLLGPPQAVTLEA